MDVLTTYGIPFGEHTITLIEILSALLILALTYYLSGKAQAQLTKRAYPRARVPEASGRSINKLVHYAILFLGFLVAFSQLGFSLTTFALFSSAIGVGVGFGLQEFVKNFISGIILLFERPIKVGDTIEVGTKRCKVTEIGLRATYVRDIDNAEVILPNWDLITKQVTNWTRSDEKVKVRLPIHVSLTEDLDHATEVALKCAAENKYMLNDPKPIIYYQEIGEHAIKMEIIGWVPEYSARFPARNTLFKEVIEAFRNAHICIPHPTRTIKMETK